MTGLAEPNPSSRLSIAEQTTAWIRIRAEERDAAMAGGRTWAEYVARAEATLKRPWDEIRREFNRMDRAAGRNTT